METATDVLKFTPGKLRLQFVSAEEQAVGRFVIFLQWEMAYGIKA
jgi:hypothetical protein